MIVIASALTGALLGANLARRNGGRRWDMAQYAAACAIIGVLLGLFATIFIERMV